MQNTERSDLATALQVCGERRLTVITKRMRLYTKFKIHRIEQEATECASYQVERVEVSC